MVQLLSIFTISLFITLIILYISKKYALFIDQHNTNEPQKFHENPTPRAGGIGIFVSSFFLLSTSMHWLITLTLLLAFLSGIFEDFHRSLTARTRLILQTIAALSATLLIDAVITYLGLGITMPYLLGVLFSIFAIVGLMNAINIIDGFNGLASGTVLLMLSALALAAHSVANHLIVEASLITIAAILGFFVLNFPKGYIFLGDGGAYLLGFITALLGINLAGNTEAISPWFILSIFIYPVWEVIFSILRKKKSGKSPLEPDTLHMHMLIYRHITKNNPLTAVFINIAIAPFIFVPLLFANSSLSNIASITLFILCYSLLYQYLYKKDTTTV